MNSSRVFMILYFSGFVAVVTAGVYYTVHEGELASALHSSTYQNKGIDQSMIHYICLLKCNQHPSCKGVNFQSNGDCQLLMSLILNIAVVNGNYLYKRQYNCPGGYSHFFGWGSPQKKGLVLPSCYMFMRNTPLPWQEARVSCGSAGGDLASIERSDENDHINSIIKKMQSRDNWFVSGTDADQEGQWYWNATGAPLEFRSWTGMVPDIDGGRNCMHVTSRMGQLLWDDGYCHSRMFYICEVSDF